MSLPAGYQSVIDDIAQKLPALLGENLFSCVLYGSAVRGHVIDKVSDINILIVLNHSTPEAHTAIADCLAGDITIAPFIIARQGMERSFEVFAIKFRSIQRNYRVLAGADPIKNFNVADERVQFLLEQALRNLRLRSVNTYVHYRYNAPRYTRFLLQTYTALFTYVSEIMRLARQEVPREFKDRLPLIQQFFKINTSILTTLEDIQSNPDQITVKSIAPLHQQLFGFLNGIVGWMEQTW